MDKIRYTASARLGVWNSLGGERNEFLVSLAQILQDHSHAVLESEQLEFVPTDNSSLASVTAICDKIVNRGNPTLVALDFERTLLNGPCRQYLNAEELQEGHGVGFQLSSSPLRIHGTTSGLLMATQDLLSLPYRSETACAVGAPALPPEHRSLASEEEDLFLDQFKTAFGDYLSTRLHRQVLIQDLAGNHPDDEFTQSRVDFAFQVGPIKWVFEIDGSQHNESGQKALDNARDKLLTQQGWTVHRVPAADVRNELGNWFERLKERQPSEHRRILDTAGHNSVYATTATSDIHAAAFKSILFPLAVQRCLRGLLLLYSHEILDHTRQQRVLLVEEDLPVATEAFFILHEIWKNIHILAPETPPAPSLQLDVIGGEISGEPTVYSNQVITVHHPDAPDGNYDMILSHSFLLDTGQPGHTESAYFPDSPKNLVRFRHAIGCKIERSLQWCNPVRYDLADVELSATKNNNESEPMPQEKHQALLFFLRHIFRKRDFWDGQIQVVTRLLQGKDSIVLLPTGGGKSLTYQLSGLLLPGMTIIIDPLVALMNDQAENLQNVGVDLVGFIASHLDPQVKGDTLRDMVDGRLAFTFISPERLQIQDFRNKLKAIVARFPVSLAVIDEAHCVSEWGHDFRPSYLHMPRNLKQFCSDENGRKPTIVGLTGTASFTVLSDIQMETEISDEDAIILPHSFDRQELRFDVRQIPMVEKPAALKTFKMQLPHTLRSNPQSFYNLREDRTNSGIVFCPHVNGSLGVWTVAGQLGHKNIFAGQMPKMFSGDLSRWNAHKTQTQQAFKKNRAQELVATKSFGMGIDKPNIRYTIHYVVPQSVEAFYQEAGRAGRNGIERYAVCSILYSDDNWDSALEILNEDDHQRALEMLSAINWNDRGDLLVQLWLLLNSYRGRSHDKKLSLDFWNQKLAPVVSTMSVGATNTQELSFRGNQQRDADERAIFRLMLLGMVQDYTIDHNLKCFAVKVVKIPPAQVKKHLRGYLRQYKFKDFADNKVRNIRNDTVENALTDGIDILIDFIYDEIVSKRKQALRTMGELCRSFTSDQDFREAILAYLQESEFSKELRNQWANKNFEEIGGLEAIHGLLGRVKTLEEVKRLVGTTRRLLDDDPQNLALRYLSMCARAQNEKESDSSVQQEAETLAKLINQASKENIHETDEILLSVLKNLKALRPNRPNLLNKVGDHIFRHFGTRGLARSVLGSDLDDFYEHSTKLLAADALRILEKCTFYKSI